MEQAQRFESDVGKPDAVLFFDCPKDVMEQRLLNHGETGDENAGVWHGALSINKPAHPLWVDGVPTRMIHV